MSDPIEVHGDKKQQLIAVILNRLISMEYEFTMTNKEHMVRIEMDDAVLVIADRSLDLRVISPESSQVGKRW